MNSSIRGRAVFLEKLLTVPLFRPCFGLSLNVCSSTFLLDSKTGGMMLFSQGADEKIATKSNRSDTFDR